MGCGVELTQIRKCKQLAEYKDLTFLIPESLFPNNYYIPKDIANISSD